ncbi:MAG TPA: 2-C-methyl-D-erythritol 4-phosphate cytidylyltransferase [Steroidobacteraceae bacterium]|nr:2-C-methyl-D-erythritol 4-phosphate cytidylyltransferase [Steroidobacteraceae bacterium]
MTVKYWVVVPAAGSARRMGDGSLPKQYLQLAGRSVIEWALAPFLERGDCERIIVVLAEQDRQWAQLPLSHHPRVATTTGGAERVDSVRAGLRALAAYSDERDWVLVHDAARPCLRAADLDRLIDELRDDAVGGLLGAPVVDTLKRADQAQRVQETVSRASLWRALTPQMFRYGVLDRALRAVDDSRAPPTDEAQAVEALGLQPRLVRGDPDNIKITLPDDVERAARLLESWSTP